MAQALNYSSSLAKTSILLLFLHHLFLFSSPTTATTATTTTPVLDIEGNPLEVGSEYYIQEARAGFFGGLRLRSRPTFFSSCPKFVFRTKMETDPGHPVEFLPLNSTQKTIDVSDVIRIRFTGKGICRSDVWQLTKEWTNGQFYVSTAGSVIVVGIYDLFKFENMGTLRGVYKIRYTHPEEHYDPDMLGGDIGILEENGISWLGVSDEPFVVYFVKKQYNKVE